MRAALAIADAATMLRRSGVVAYPTEAVWGLGCDPFDEAAVMRLLALKQRPVDKGLILIAGAVPGAAGGYVRVTDAVKRKRPKDAPYPAALRAAAAASAKE